jgi:hypothetical protein
VADRNRTEDEWQQLHAAVARLRAGIMAIVFGMVGGVGLFLATIWLVIRGGPNVGKHLGLLVNYFPGYSVTWKGAVIGIVYGTLIGALVGWLVSWVYNLVAARRGGSS